MEYHIINGKEHANAILEAVGKPGLIHGEMLKPGAAVIDIGINQVERKRDDGTIETRIVGGVDFDSAHKVAGWLTLVPGGVGPVTVVMLLQNTIVAVERQKQRYAETMRAEAV